MEEGKTSDWVILAIMIAIIWIAGALFPFSLIGDANAEAHTQTTSVKTIGPSGVSKTTYTTSDDRHNYNSNYYGRSVITEPVYYVQSQHSNYNNYHNNSYNYAYPNHYYPQGYYGDYGYNYGYGHGYGYNTYGNYTVMPSNYREFGR